MKRKLWGTLLLIGCGVLIFGCAAKQSPIVFKSASLPEASFESKVDNFMVILDASYSMNRPYKNQKKLSIAKAFVSTMNQTLPELDFNAGLRTFGDYCKQVTDVKTKMLYGMAQYKTAGLASGLDQIQCAGGNSPLCAAITAASEDLKNVSGKTALIIVADGKDPVKDPLEAAKRLADQFGDRICIYSVLVGDDPHGMKVLEQISAVSGCGFFQTAESLTSPVSMADFVKTVFLTEAPKPATVPRDSDGDGVTDSIDRCPNTPAGVVVDNLGCPLDMDMDGVPDYKDQCPNTPRGATVDSRGCWMIGMINFDLDKAKILSDAIPVLNDIIEVMKKNPALQLKIAGHTCNIGKEAYNDKLSERRAIAAKEYLADHGVDEDRIITEGYGYEMPIKSNDTEKGREMNRRAEFTPMK